MFSGKQKEIIGQTIGILQGICVYFADFHNFKDVSFCPTANGAANVRQSVALTAARQYKKFQRRQQGVNRIHFRFDFLYVFFGNGAVRRTSFRRQITAQRKQIMLNPQQELPVVRIADFFQQAGDERI